MTQYLVRFVLLFFKVKEKEVEKMEKINRSVKSLNSLPHSEKVLVNLKTLISTYG